MKNEFKLFGFIAIIAIITIGIIACNNGSTDEIDEWSRVTSGNQLNGTWKGSTTEVTMTFEELRNQWTNEGDTTFEPYEEWENDFWGNMKVTCSFHFTVGVTSISGNIATFKIDGIYRLKFSEGNISTRWTDLKSLFQENVHRVPPEGPPVYNDSDYSMDFPWEQSESFSFGANSDGILINQSGNVIKIKDFYEWWNIYLTKH